ncbi:hypothetical protein N7486_009207 [Penicillium sp. IBT 16267x]|nr:hypothetical protein N7486_009207 [Penicillium sp. IBT 16267x]
MGSNTFLSPYTNDSVADLPITVRFSASIPDLPLDVSAPETTTGAGLKQLIRAKLPASLSSHRLRLIYAGRGLGDTTALTTSLKLPPSPSRTPRPATEEEDHPDGTSLDKGADDAADSKSRDKGKQPVRDQRLRIYIHCSIGDIALSEADLAAEAEIASTLLQSEKEENVSSLLSTASSTIPHRSGSSVFPSRSSAAPETTTTPAPRGFDRLLTAGFTAAEVTALRSQFLAVQSVSRTPDTMPSGEELRDLEDRWMDEGSTAAGMMGGGEGAGVGDDDGGLGSGSRSAMDDMLWGAVMGFFWPIGCAMWLRREEGVWSWRKGVAVFVGVLVNAAFGAMRIMN